MSIYPVDLAVILIYLAATTALGAWWGRGQRSVEAYLLGDRRLPWWAVLGSIVASETSTITFLSIPGLAYRDGGDIRFLQLALGFLTARLIIAVAIVPWYFQGKLLTAYQVLAGRFGPRAERMASWLFLAARNLGDGLRLFLTASVLQVACGLSIYAAIAVLGAVTILYTWAGGLRSVIWNDCLQWAVYMLGGLVILATLSAQAPGGWEGILQFGSQSHRLRCLDWDASWSNPYSFWAGLIGGGFLSLGTHGVDQMMVQRYLAAKSQRQAACAVGLSGLVVLAQFALFLFIGIGLAAVLDHRPPEQAATLAADQALTYFVVHRLPGNVGIIGLILAGLLAAAMSTLSSSLNASASVAVAELGASASTDQARLLRMSRGWTVAFGVFQMLIAAAAYGLSTSVISDALAIAGFVNGVLLGAFFLGKFVPRADESAVLYAMFSGLVILTCVKFFTDIAWPWYTLIGCVATFSYGWLDRPSESHAQGVSVGESS